jgi:hypothetical protein
VTDCPSTDGFEERAVAVVLIVAGLLGVVIGLQSAPDAATELVVGIGLLAIGLWTYLRSRIAPVV